MTIIKAPKYNLFAKNERLYYAYGVIVAVVVLFSLLVKNYQSDNQYLKNQNDLLQEKNESLLKKNEILNDEIKKILKEKK
jgi:hypothetical protein